MQIIVAINVILRVVGEAGGGGDHHCTGDLVTLRTYDLGSRESDRIRTRIETILRVTMISKVVATRDYCAYLSFAIVFIALSSTRMTARDRRHNQTFEILPNLRDFLRKSSPRVLFPRIILRYQRNALFIMIATGLASRKILRELRRALQVSPHFDSSEAKRRDCHETREVNDHVAAASTWPLSCKVGDGEPRLLGVVTKYSVQKNIHGTEFPFPIVSRLETQTIGKRNKLPRLRWVLLWRENEKR